MCSRTKFATTASNDPSANGSASASPKRKSSWGWRRRGEREHPLRDVDADHERAAFGGRGGDVAGTGRHVQDARAAIDLGGVEQRTDEPRRDRLEEILVAGNPLLPARCLERVERARLDRRFPHPPTIPAPLPRFALDAGNPPNGRLPASRE